MKITKNSDLQRRKYQENAHIERSLAFHALLRRSGQSVKNLFSQPERLFKQFETTKRRVTKMKPGENIADCGAV